MEVLVGLVLAGSFASPPVHAQSGADVSPGQTYDTVINACARRALDVGQLTTEPRSDLFARSAAPGSGSALASGQPARSLDPVLINPLDRLNPPNPPRVQLFSDVVFDRGLGVTDANPVRRYYVTYTAVRF